MFYSVQPNEIVGFIHFFCHLTSREQEEAWLERCPELKNTDFIELTTLMRQYEKRNSKDKIFLSNYLYGKIDQIKNGEDLKKRILTFPKKDTDKNKINQMLDSVWPVYHSFYEQNKEELSRCAQKANNFMNENAIKSLENVAKFYGYKIPSDYTGKTYLIPVADDKEGQFKHGGQNTNGGQMELIWFGDTYLKGNPEPPYWMILHEAAHAIFRKSGGWEKSVEYWADDNPVVQFFENNPLSKRNPNQSGKDAAHWILNEGLTTAFQGIFEEDVLNQKRKKLYDRLFVNRMAHKMIPLLREAMKTGETFGPDFLKKFEKEFMTVVSEMSAFRKKIKELSFCPHNTSKEAKNHSETKTKVPRINTKNKTTFPAWLKNPSWLWQNKKQK